MNEVLRYDITAFSKAAGKRVHIFTWVGYDEPENGVGSAVKDAIKLGLIEEFSEFRAELIVDTTRHYVTRDGRKVTIHEVVPFNSAGEEVTFPIKCSIREDKKYARSQYHILDWSGRESCSGKKSGSDIVGYWDAKVPA